MKVNINNYQGIIISPFWFNDQNNEAADLSPLHHQPQKQEKCAIDG
jgi:hypothetical protein